MTGFKTMDSMVALPSLCAIEITGADAAVFLQGQMTRDVASLSEDFVLTGFCTPQGKLYATPRIALHDDSFLLVLPQEQSETFMRRLSRYILRSKVTISVRSDLYVLARMQGDRTIFELIPGLVQCVDDESVFWESEARSAQPWIFNGTEGLFVPQALNFDRFEAVSYTKGCYTGQEVVGRIHWQGKVSKRLCAFSAEGILDVSPGELLMDACGEPFATILYGAGQSLLALLDAAGRNPLRTPQGIRLVALAQ